MTSTTEATASAERAALGAALESRAAYERVAQVLDGSAFAEPRHELIWDAITWVNEQGTPEDPATADEVLVAMRLHQLGQLDQVGGALYLDDLVAASVLSSNATYYARQVKQFALARATAVLGTRLTQAGNDPTALDEIDQIIGAAADELLTLREGAQPEQVEVAPDPLGLIDALQTDHQAVPTGLTDLDAALSGGLHPGQLVVVAARTGGGKSVLGLQMLINNARAGRRGLIYSLEMGIETDLGPRLLANVAGVNLTRLRSRQLTDEDWARIASSVEEIDGMPMLWSDQPTWTPSQIAHRIGVVKRRHPDLAFVVVDYLQLLTPDGSYSNRQEAVAAMTRQLKLTAKRHGIPIVLQAQLNRGPEARADKRPELSDLRESGSIEQDADVVILLHDPVKGGDLERVGELDVIVAKSRHGELRTVPVSAQMQYARLANMAHPEDRLRAA